MTGTVCYRHPDRPAGVRCQRCDKPICPACMNSAAVGFQCPQCFSDGVKSIPRTRTSLGGIQRANGQLVTFVLIAINIFVFVVLQVSPQARASLPLTPMYVAAEPWRLITGDFSHFQLWHILANMLALYQFGLVLERMLGRLRFTLLYLGAALGGSVVVWLFSAPGMPTVGASGAVLGLVGALLVIERSRNLDVSWIVGYVGITALLTFLLPFISWQGHLGGFLAGAGLGWLFLQDTNRRRNKAFR
ncbi:rhomboid family intramembrane serine protease [Kribbella sandramycini]|uniref:Membrane associated rhomboid family serine protease n=1 Tax=Kribbella sandramycini TaxID=60450 RepID=A0A7Y4L1M0_9ACTN|nr:membrane associated rhomboid family serine protease [Kribbella sandramycini]NOL41847.1 rhomboid family intramembrane serine protease [Kribbella sandramycini]